MTLYSLLGLIGISQAIRVTSSQFRESQKCAPIFAFQTVFNFGAGLPDGLFSNQKFPIWVNFGGPENGKCWYILGSLRIFYGHLVYLLAIFSLVLIYCVKKNLATLLWSSGKSRKSLTSC
jgi:hypothetical protein